MSRIRRSSLVLALVSFVSFISVTAEASSLGQKLRKAAVQGDLEATHVLSQKLRTVDMADEAGITPLMLAAENGHLHVIKVLVGHGASLDAVDSFYKASALVWAARSGRTDVARFLVGQGAGQVDAALEAATTAGHLLTAEAILESGRVTSTKLDEVRETAEEEGSKEQLALLETAKAAPVTSTGAVAMPKLRRFTGRYQSADGWAPSISLLNGQLQFSMKGRLLSSLITTGETTFQVEGNEAMTFTFELDGETATSFLLTYPGGTANYMRIGDLE